MQEGLAPNRNNAKTPIILDKVASLTTIRDIDIFEFSFLKTIAEMLKVDDICLYKIDVWAEPCRLIRYTSATEYTETSHKRDETKEIHIENIDFPEEIKQAQKWIKSTDKVYVTKQDDGYFIVYPVGLNNTVGYLALNLPTIPSETENLVLTSLLNISHNFHSLLEENQKDKLTGLLNRKTFDDNINKIQSLLNFSMEGAEDYTGQEKRQKGLGSQFWLGIIDIDFFKKINDVWGHVFGDEVLLLVSQLFKETFRPTDLVFRFGGEEFVVIINVNDKQEAEKIFERFRHSVEAFKFPQVDQITVSTGITQIMQESAISSEIVGRADLALYHGKHNGRNNCFIYEDLVEQGLLQEKHEEGGIELF